MSKRVITLGTWRNKPIEWIVLKEEKGLTLVFCKGAVNRMDCSWNGTSGTWKYLNIRIWLNNDFFNNAFTDEEKKKIVNSFLKDPESTKDDVFLLSYDEANNLMTPVEREYGENWYLRTPHNSGYMKSIYYFNGYFTYNSASLPIRPAMYIKEKIND